MSGYDCAAEFVTALDDGVGTGDGKTAGFTLGRVALAAILKEQRSDLGEVGGVKPESRQ